MNSAAGIVLIVGGAALAVAVGLGGRRRLPAPAVAAVLALAGAAMGAGALLVQERPVSVFEWLLAVSLCALATALNVRVLLGGFGPSAAREAPWSR